MVYLKARCHYGVCDPTKLGPLPGLWAQVLGSDDVARLDDLFARLIWANDGDNDALDRYAREYRQIIGPPPPPPPSSGQGDGAAGEGAASPGDEQGSRHRRGRRLGHRGERRRRRAAGDPAVAGRSAPAGSA